MLRLRHLPSLVTIAAVLAAPCFTPRSAQAQTNASDTARVTELFKSGKAAFAKGDMAEAEKLFAQAFAIRKSSDIAANLAQSELEQQKYRSAAEHFSWALANLLPSASDAQRKAVETGLARARAEVGVLRLDIQPDGADVLVGALAVGKSPIAGGVFVEPGEVIVSVKHDDFIALDKRVLVGKGTEQGIEIVLNPKEDVKAPSAGEPGVTPALGAKAPSSAPGDSSQPKSLVPAFVATGVAVVGGVAGLVFTLGANSKEDDADDHAARLQAAHGPDACKGEAPANECDDLASERDSVDSSRNLALGAFVVGGVAALTAGYLYWDALSPRRAATTSGALSRATRVARPRLDLLPSIELAPARGASSLHAIKLGVSGTF